VILLSNVSHVVSVAAVHLFQGKEQKHWGRTSFNLWTWVPCSLSLSCCDEQWQPCVLESLYFFKVLATQF
jgi:hypothetical protein